MSQNLTVMHAYLHVLQTKYNSLINYMKNKSLWTGRTYLGPLIQRLLFLCICTEIITITVIVKCLFDWKKTRSVAAGGVYTPVMHSSHEMHNQCLNRFMQVFSI